MKTRPEVTAVHTATTRLEEPATHRLLVRRREPPMTALQQNAPSQPRVSVITATFNAAKTLEACLESVRSQDYPNLEHIIVDGNSQDETITILERLGSDVKWISESDRGIYDAWNKGLRMASGEWICFLGADDVLLPGAVSSYMRLAQQNPSATYLSSKIRWISPAGRPRIIGKPWSWSQFRRYMSTAHPGSMHHRSLYENYGEYNIGLRIVGDYEFLLRPGSSLQTAFLPQITVDMQGGGTSDGLPALDETRRVKIDTAKRHAWLASWERLMGRQMFRIRRRFLS